jgi:hypothetical protein
MAAGMSGDRQPPALVNPGRRPARSGISGFHWKRGIRAADPVSMRAATRVSAPRQMPPLPGRTRAGSRETPAAPTRACEERSRTAIRELQCPDRIDGQSVRRTTSVRAPVPGPAAAVTFRSPETGSQRRVTAHRAPFPPRIDRSGRVIADLQIRSTGPVIRGHCLLILSRAQNHETCRRRSVAGLASLGLSRGSLATNCRQGTRGAP